MINKSSYRYSGALPETRSEKQVRIADHPKDARGLPPRHKETTTNKPSEKSLGAPPSAQNTYVVRRRLRRSARSLLRDNHPILLRRRVRSSARRGGHRL